MKMIHRGEKGFTLIELLVVIAILGVIAAVVALSVAGFFGRGTLQAANTELHQAQTAIIAMMADAESTQLDGADDDAVDIKWGGDRGKVFIGEYDAADYLYGPFRAVYTINRDTECDEGHGIGAIIDGDASGDGGWGDAIWFCTHYTSWTDEACDDPCDNCNDATD